VRRDAAIPALLVLACATASVAVGCGAGVEVAPSAGRATGTQRPRLAGSVSVTVPRGWHLLPPPVTGLAFPVDRLLLTSYPAARGGNCGPDRAESALPAHGALIYLMEYRPRLGPAWAGIRRSAFPPRPAHFALRQRNLTPAECWKVPSYLIRFRAADRPFQLHVALGPHAGAARRAQVLRALDSLRFTPLPPPPPDPYAGWHALHLETGDTLRTPPGWLAVANPSPRRQARPRTLFLAANQALTGLPSRRPSRLHQMPARFPPRTLARFPADGVLLRVREDRPGPANAAWPDLPPTATWPAASDFAPVAGGIAGHWPALSWLRAATEQRTTRFSLSIVSGPQATDADRQRAIKAAASFAFSVGSFRDRPCRRACRSRRTPVRVVPAARPRTRVALPGSIVDVTSAAGRVWALTCNAACHCVATHSSGNLVSIEARTGRVLSNASATRPYALAAGASGVWTIDFWGGRATRYDPVTGRELARVKLTLPRPVAPGDRRFLPSYVAVGAERVWVSTARGYVVGIDPRSNAIAETLRVAPDASGPLLALGHGVWIGEGTGVRRFDPASGLSRPFAIRDHRRRELAVADLSFASGAVWATGEWATTSDRRGHREHTLTGDTATVELDPATGTVRSILTLPRGAYVKARSAKDLWIAVPRTDQLLRLDTDSRRLASTARVTSTGPQLRSPGRDLWTSAGPRSHSLVQLRALR
jgi:hypothetical protein